MTQTRSRLVNTEDPVEEAENLTSRPLDVLVSWTGKTPGPSAARSRTSSANAIRDLTLRPGARLPSTRDLARELGVSRPIVVDAYAQLAGEGYLELRPGTRPRVTGCAGPCQPPTTRRADPVARAALRLPSRRRPTSRSFPRSAWLRSVREALAGMREADFGYTDPHGERGAPARPPRLPRPSARRGGRRGPSGRHQRLVPGADARVPRAGGAGREAGRDRGPVPRRGPAVRRRAPGSSWCRCRWTARGSGWTRWSGRRWTRC